MTYFSNLYSLSLDAAPWLLLGFLAAGLIKAWIPERALSRWLGGAGIWPITKAALIGAPLPLCSCGVLPAALGLRRNGASRGSTVSFLIATPETGVDSIALSYVMLGPVMAVIRPVAAIASAIFSGLLTSLVTEPRITASDTPSPSSSGLPDTAITTSCCAGNGCADGAKTAQRAGPAARTWQGMRYALDEMMEDLLVWLTVGLLLAALTVTLVPPMSLAQWGSGLPAMLLMLLVGIPMYICATASTPIAAALLFAGISPGTVLVFLMAGPATNIATVGIIRREMGTRATGAYLLGIAISSLAFGMLTDWLVPTWGIDIPSQLNTSTEWLPYWLAQLSGAVLLAAALRLLARKLKRRWQTRQGARRAEHPTS